MILHVSIYKTGSHLTTVASCWPTLQHTHFKAVVVFSFVGGSLLTVVSFLFDDDCVEINVALNLLLSHTGIVSVRTLL